MEGTALSPQRSLGVCLCLLVAPIPGSPVFISVLGPVFCHWGTTFPPPSPGIGLSFTGVSQGLFLPFRNLAVLPLLDLLRDLKFLKTRTQEKQWKNNYKSCLWEPDLTGIWLGIRKPIMCGQAVCFIPSIWISSKIDGSPWAATFAKWTPLFLHFDAGDSQLPWLHILPPSHPTSTPSPAVLHHSSICNPPLLLERSFVLPLYLTRTWYLV